MVAQYLCVSRKSYLIHWFNGRAKLDIEGLWLYDIEGLCLYYQHCYIPITYKMINLTWWQQQQEDVPDLSPIFSIILMQVICNWILPSTSQSSVLQRLPIFPSWWSGCNQYLKNSKPFILFHAIISLYVGFWDVRPRYSMVPTHSCESRPSVLASMLSLISIRLFMLA